MSNPRPKRGMYDALGPQMSKRAKATGADKTKSGKTHAKSAQPQQQKVKPSAGKLPYNDGAESAPRAPKDKFGTPVSDRRAKRTLTRS